MLKAQLISAIKAIYNTSKCSRLDDDELALIAPDLLLVSEHFSITIDQAIFLSILFSLSIKRSCDVADVASHLRIETVEMLLYTEDFAVLTRRGFVYRSNSKPKSKQTLLSDSFTVTPNLVRSIIEAKPFIEFENKPCDTAFDFFEIVAELGVENEGWDEAERVSVPTEFEGVFQTNSHLSLVKRLKAISLPMEDCYVFCVVTWQTLNGNHTNGLNSIIEKYFFRKTERVNYLQRLLHNKCKLILLGLCKAQNETFYNSVDLSLTAKSADILKQEGILINLNTPVNENNVISPETITHKKLFYNNWEQEQIAQLVNVLLERNFKKAQKQLIKNGMSGGGILALLHGASGVGKTVLCLQIAKLTKRKIMQVDLSSMRSKWYGESEKIIKQIFVDYASLKKSLDKAPILLFNEADVIINTRAVGASNSSQSIQNTENTIQNILLNELENFDGILLATTNLVANIDSAFSRRFLFKIRINHPDASIRKKIWMSKMPDLEPEQCNILSEFNLTGGQIDNVLKRKLLQSVLNNSMSFSDLVAFCEAEQVSFGVTRNSVGFRSANNVDRNKIHNLN